MPARRFCLFAPALWGCTLALCSCQHNWDDFVYAPDSGPVGPQDSSDGPAQDAAMDSSLDALPEADVLESCSAGQQDCQDNTPRKCVNGHWQLQSACAAPNPYCVGKGQCGGCRSDSDCPVSQISCLRPFCSLQHQCSLVPKSPGTVVTQLPAGDCHRIECDEDGGTRTASDPSDSDDFNPCTLDQCQNDMPSHTSNPGASCGTGSQSGHCSEATTCYYPLNGCAGINALAQDAAWPTEGYCASHRNQSPFAGPQQLNRHALSVPSSSSPALGLTIGADETLYVSGQAPMPVLALRPNGSEIWRHSAQGVRCTSLGADGTLYAPAQDHSLYAIDTAGKTRWATPLAEAISSCPVISSEGNIHLAVGNSLVALSPEGSVLWSFPTKGPIVHSPTLGLDDILYVLSSDGYLYAVNKDGSRRWSFQLHALATTYTVYDYRGVIYIAGGGDNRLYAVKPDATPLWFLGLDGEVRGLALGSDRTLYALTQNNTLYAIDSQRNVLWTRSIDSLYSQRASLLLDANNNIYASIQGENPRTVLYSPQGQELANVQFAGELRGIGPSGRLYMTRSSENAAFELLWLGP